jgi:hypothetical protein
MADVDGIGLTIIECFFPGLIIDQVENDIT